MDWQKLGSGMGVASFKLCCGIHNRRFMNGGRRVMDANPKSYLNNLKRALIMKQYAGKLDASYENPFLIAIKEHDTEFLHFTSQNWVKLNSETLSELNFPIIEAQLNQAKVFDNISDINAYWLSCGPYEIKTASHYLNTETKASQKHFEVQYLKPDSTLYLKIKAEYFPFSEVTIIKLRVPSSHKQVGFHSEGYKVILGYHQVESFTDGKPELLRLKNATVDADSLNFPDYYFQNIFRFSFCSCKTGRRDLGFCAHRLAAALYFGTKLDFSKTTYKAIDASSFRSRSETTDSS